MEWKRLGFLDALGKMLAHIHSHVDTWEGFRPMAHRALDKPQSFVEQTKGYLQPQLILPGTNGSLQLYT